MTSPAFPRAAPAALALLALSACSSWWPKPRAASPAPAPSVTLVARGLQLVPGAEGAVRIGVQAATPNARVIVNHPPEANVDVCPLAGISSPIPGSGECVVDIGTGVRETVNRPGGLGAVAVILKGRSLVTADVTVEYDDGGRAVSVRLPRVAPPAGASACKDNGCNPLLEIMPVRGGDFTASATWQGGPAKLQLLSGRVLARSWSATGLPYVVPAERRGPSPLDIRARLSAPAEYALAFLSLDSSADLTGIAIEAQWP